MNFWNLNLEKEFWNSKKTDEQFWASFGSRPHNRGMAHDRFRPTRPMPAMRASVPEPRSPRVGHRPWHGRRRWPDRLGVAGVMAWAPVLDEEPTGHGGRRRSSLWRSGVGGAEEKLRGGSVLPGDGALASYGQP
jgi:hypothetical protein